MHGFGWYHAKRSQRKTNTVWYHMWNLKNETSKQQKRKRKKINLKKRKRLRYREQTRDYQQGDGRGRSEVRVVN